MLTRRIKVQLAIFGVLTVFSMVTIARDYLQVDRMAGIGLREVTFEFRDASGIYPGAVISYRGVKVGKVTRLELDDQGRGAVVTAELDDDMKIPAELTAEAHSTSAIGENYIELLPVSDNGPYLEDGSVIDASQTIGIESTGDLLEGVTDLSASVPGRDTRILLEELAHGLGGADNDFRRLLAASQQIVDAANADIDSVETLLTEAGPFLDTSATVAPDVRASVSDLAPFLVTLDQSRNHVNTLLQETPALARSLNALLTDVQSDVPILLADLLATSEIVKVYLPGTEQILVLYPAVMAAVQAASTYGGAPGTIYLGARLTVNDPPNCYAGFLPIKNQRDFHDESIRPEIPDDLYCKVAHDDPRAVRGARNTPCFNVPGRRAASVEECLGRKIGTVDDPLQRGRTLAAYDPENGRVLAPDGRFFEFGGLRSTEMKEKETWQDLFLK